MKALFVHPHGRNWLGNLKDISSIFNLMPPLGMMSIAAYLEAKGMEVELMDCYARPMPTPELVAHIIGSKPDVVGFSCTTSSFLEGYGIAHSIKEQAPEIKVIFGGAHACSVGVSLLDTFPAIDYLIIGEGEVTFYELLAANFSGVEHIPGIGHRRDGKGVLSGIRQHIADLDSLPFPAYHRLDQFPGRYNLPLFSYPAAPNTSIISSRGCPYHCSYCDRSVFSRGFRFNSPGYIFEHLKYLHRDFGIRHVFFYDDLFTFDRSRVEELCRLLVDNRLPVTYNCIARLEHVDEELVGLLKKSGCWQVNFGIESGDPEVLKKHRKYMALDAVHQKLKMVKTGGMRVKGLFMVGLPGEDEAAIRRTIDYALTLPLDEINVTKFTPFPGAPIYENICQQGEFREDWPDMNCMNFVFIPHGMTLEQLENLYNEFIRRFYRRSRIHWGYTKMLWKSPHSIKMFLRNLPEILRFEMKQKW
ncbi:radical SAM domain iron-sulfur cluster-binding oxidoreductase with cobamide-binding-like domain [Geotalea daltonii FRC-32]|uniref:Radical SAM domain iron-sulfur cluster-binding oxidoreductase with cobamide-binding-like domain n=1 Tax=Geotalea daltonii (strain DSM 22248 / JCM 15807 / FRC-32) TaxID=316067 RepID=B9M808_GEODF|nr:radical SAM protein [Geotalea daltonii]ACM20274.1 radical SAM domain iron-sulfur cluster-binding oxidoreductase with cobamide-binding-like domain [Geotalea daltonii FRC-32]